MAPPPTSVGHLSTTLLSQGELGSASVDPSDFSSYFEDDVYKPVVVRSQGPPNTAGALSLAVNAAAESDLTVVHHSRPTLAILTGLRGVLAVWIICHNMIGWWEPSTPPEMLASWPLLSGSVAVSMFFCLSGFVLTYSYGDHQFTDWPCYFSFLGRRYGRMMPMYLLAVIMGLGGEVHSIQNKGWDVWTVLHWIAVFTGTNSWFPWPEYAFDEMHGFTLFNGSLWSIQTELFFYCCFPLLCRLVRWSLGVSSVGELGVRDQRLNTRLKRLLCWFGLLTLTSLLNTVAAWHSFTMQLFCYGVPVFRISEFMMGMVTCCIFLLLAEAREGPPDTSIGSGRQLVDLARSCWPLHCRWSLDAVCLCVGAMLVASGLLVKDAGLDTHLLQQNPGTFASLLCLILLLAVLTYSPYSTSSRRGVVSWILSQPIVLQMGVVSFAFYTFHLVPLYYLLSINQPAIQSIAVEFCAAMGLACMAHVYVEKAAYLWVAKRVPKCECSVSDLQK